MSTSPNPLGRPNIPLRSSQPPLPPLVPKPVKPRKSSSLPAAFFLICLFLAGSILVYENFLAPGPPAEPIAPTPVILPTTPEATPIVAAPVAVEPAPADSTPSKKPDGIPILGANGKTVNFAGVLSVNEQGIRAEVSNDTALILVPWASIDTAALKTNNPTIALARDMAIRQKQNVLLKLGIFSGLETYEEALTQINWLLHTTKLYNVKTVPSGSTIPQQDREQRWYDAARAFIIHRPLLLKSNDDQTVSAYFGAVVADKIRIIERQIPNRTFEMTPDQRLFLEHLPVVVETLNHWILHTGDAERMDALLNFFDDVEGHDHWPLRIDTPAPTQAK